LKTEAASLEAQTNSDTSQSHTLRQDDLTFKVTRTASDIQGIKNYVAALEQTLVKETLRCIVPVKDSDARIRIPIEGLRRGAQELKECINLLMSRSNLIEEHRQALQLQTVSTETGKSVIVKHYAYPVLRPTMTTYQSDKFSQIADADKLLTYMCREAAELEKETNSVMSRHDNFRHECDSLIYEAQCIAGYIEAMKEVVAEQEERINLVNSKSNALNLGRDALISEVGRIADHVMVMKKKATSFWAWLDLVSLQSDKLVGEREFLSFEALCISDDIKDMKDEVVKFNERITLVKLQSDINTQNGDAIALETTCTGADKEETKVPAADEETNHATSHRATITNQVASLNDMLREEQTGAVKLQLALRAPDTQPKKEVVAELNQRTNQETSHTHKLMERIRAFAIILIRLITTRVKNRPV
jgi:hypothetical protein